MGIDLIATDEHVEGEGRTAVFVIGVLGGILVFALELQRSPHDAVADGGRQLLALHLHAIFLR